MKDIYIWVGFFLDGGREGVGGGVVGYLYPDWEGSVVRSAGFWGGGGVHGGSCGWCVGGVWAWIFVGGIFLGSSLGIWGGGVLGGLNAEEMIDGEGSTQRSRTA